jgi:integrase
MGLSESSVSQSNEAVLPPLQRHVDPQPRKMEEEYIDTHQTARRYQLALECFANDSEISDYNRQLVLSFIRDAALGKTVLRKAKKKIGPSRLMNYLKHLRPLIAFLQMDLDKVTQQHMERFVEALETDRIRSRALRVTGKELVRSNAKLSPGYKVDIKITIKKFYKWLWGRNEVYPPVVSWIDTFLPQSAVAALTEAEVERMIDRATSILQRALIQTFFDGGFRICELLNVRLLHVSFRSVDPNDPTKRCFFLRVPFSKTLMRTVALPMQASTKWLKLWLEDHPAKPIIREDGTLEAPDLRLQLFPMSDTAARLMVHRAGKRALGKRVYPHLLRHASATFWSNKLPHFKLCKRFGWTMTSKMPQRYIDREGVDEMSIAQMYLAERSDSLSAENQRLKDELASLQSSSTAEIGKAPGARTESPARIRVSDGSFVSARHLRRTEFDR